MNPVYIAFIVAGLILIIVGAIRWKG